jgi:dihydropyrimidinase
MSLLIKNGRVITATDDYFADVYVEGETVKQIGRDLGVKADKVIDAQNKLVIPGGIDPHTHMDMPFGGTTSADDFETGTIAAAFGGTTTIVDFAIQSKGESTLKGLDTWHKKADGRATIDYAFHMIVTDMPDERLSEMNKLADEGGHLVQAVHGVPRRVVRRRRHALPRVPPRRRERHPHLHARRERHRHR